MDYPATIIIVEPNSIFRAGLLQVMQKSGFVNCIAIASVNEIRPNIPAEFGDILFLADLGSDEESISAGIDFIKETCSSARIVLLSDGISERQLAAAWQAGANGLVLKFVAPEVLTKSVELVLLGQPVFPMQVIEAMRSLRPTGMVSPIELRSALSRLSRREMEVLNYMCMGNANKVIARSAAISEATVKVHVKAILRKLGARNRTEAALWASPHGLVGEPASARFADSIGSTASGVVITS